MAFILDNCPLNNAIIKIEQKFFELINLNLWHTDSIRKITF